MDYYQILGVTKETPIDEIKKVYKKLALKYHPDKNKNDNEATEMFKKISEAYGVLSDPVKKRNYDLGINIDLGQGFDPFSMFNQFFQGQNMDSFVQEFFSHQNMDAQSGLYDDILGGPEMKFSIHTFANMPGMENMEGINFFDIVNQTKEKLKDLRTDFPVRRDEKTEELKSKIAKLEKKHYKKCQDQEIEMKVSIEDVLEQRNKKIKYKYNHNKELVSKKIAFKLDQDLDNLEYLLEGYGHVDNRYEKPGDLRIKLKLEPNKIRRFEKSLVIFLDKSQMTKKIKLNNVLGVFEFPDLKHQIYEFRLKKSFGKIKNVFMVLGDLGFYENWEETDETPENKFIKNHDENPLFLFT